MILKCQELSKMHLVLIGFEEQRLLDLWLLLDHYIISDFFTVTKIHQDVELDLTEQLMERKGSLTHNNVTGEGTVRSGKASGV